MCVNGWMRVPWALQTLTLDQTLHQLHSECCFIMSHFCCGRLHCRVHYDSKCVCSHTQYNRKIQQTWLKMGKHQEEKCWITEIIFFVAFIDRTDWDTTGNWMGELGPGAAEVRTKPLYMGRSLQQPGQTAPRLEFRKFTNGLIQIQVFLELSRCFAAPVLKHAAGIKFSRIHIYLLKWTHLYTSCVCFELSICPIKRFANLLHRHSPTTLVFGWGCEFQWGNQTFPGSSVCSWHPALTPGFCRHCHLGVNLFINRHRSFKAVEPETPETGDGCVDIYRNPAGEELTDLLFNSCVCEGDQHTRHDNTDRWDRFISPSTVKHWFYLWFEDYSYLFVICNPLYYRLFKLHL